MFSGIRQLQLILLKVSLLLGVEVHTGVEFQGLIEPSGENGTNICQPAISFLALSFISCYYEPAVCKAVELLTKCHVFLQVGWPSCSLVLTLLLLSSLTSLSRLEEAGLSLMVRQHCEPLLLLPLHLKTQRSAFRYCARTDG